MASKTILDCDKALQSAWPKILKNLGMRFPGTRLRIVETHVPPEEQKDRFNMGRNGLGEIVAEEKVTTDVDGTIHVSPHNFYPSLAVCFDVIDGYGYRSFDVNVMNCISAMCDANNLKFLAPDIIIVNKKTK